MNIEDLTLKQIREIQAMTAGVVTQPQPQPTSEPWEIGKVYLIRTVTMTETGRLVEVTPQELVLEEACWIADTGRFADSLKTATFNEQEPFPDGRVIVGRGSVIDAVVISVAPRGQK